MSFPEYTGDANAPLTPAQTLFLLPAPRDGNEKGVASDASLTALAHNLDYVLTVGQAVDHFVAAKRKPPSTRTIQRYCIEGLLEAQKIRTVFGAEWLINEASLTRLIESEPVVTSVAGDATTPLPASLATPPNEIEIFPKVATSNASVAGDANAPATLTGETRTLAEILIENARLLAQVEGRDAIIAELKEDRSFLREEVREGRRTRDDVKNIAERMLDTLKTMAVGRLSMNSTPPQEPVQTTYADAHSGQNSDRG